MTRAIAHTYRIVHEYRRYITSALFAMCMFLIMSYAVNLYSLISHTIALQRINSEQMSLDSAVQALDTKYISVSRKITPDTLQEYGFKQGKVTAFISRTTSLGRVALAGHEL